MATATPKLSAERRADRAPKYVELRRRRAAWKPYPPETEKGRFERTRTVRRARSII